MVVGHVCVQEPDCTGRTLVARVTAPTSLTGKGPLWPHLRAEKRVMYDL